MTLYTIATAYWPYKVYMNFRIDQLWHMYRLQSEVYKIDQFVLRNKIFLQKQMEVY